MITKIKRDTKYTSSIKKWKTVIVISYVVKIWVKMTVHTQKTTVHDFYVLCDVFCVMIADGR